MDAGIATEGNLAELRKRGYHWITVKRGGVRPDHVDGVNARDPDATINTGSGHEVRAWRLSHDHENEAQLCIWSQARQEKDEAILAKKRERFEADLADLHKALVGTFIGCIIIISVILSEKSLQFRVLITTCRLR